MQSKKAEKYKVDYYGYVTDPYILRHIPLHTTILQNVLKKIQSFLKTPCKARETVVYYYVL